MNNHDATEQAYKNGYAQGVKDMAGRLKGVVNGDINKMYVLRIDGVGPLCRFIERIDEILKELTQSEKTPENRAENRTRGETPEKDKNGGISGDYCVVCGGYVPEGRHVCPNCENKE